MPSQDFGLGGSGYQAEGTITITNTGTQTFSSWQLKLTMAGDITSIWGNVALVSQVGNVVTLKGVGSTTLAPGATVTFGFVVGGGNTMPSGCTINGSTCTVTTS